MCTCIHGTHCILVQVNERLERVYRDCIKRTRDKTRIIQYRMMHQALDDSDQTGKYGISDP